MKLVIVGAGGFGREVQDYAEAIGWNVRGFLDDTRPVGPDAQTGAMILGGIDAFPFEDSDRVVVAMGHPTARQTVVQRLQGAPWASLVHPSAIVSARAHIAEGVIVGPFCYIGPHARLDAHTVLNTHVSFGHDAILQTYSVVSPLCSIGGGCVLGDGVFLGAQAVVIPRLHVGNWARIAAGSVIFGDVPERAEALGNPARWRHV